MWVRRDPAQPVRGAVLDSARRPMTSEGSPVALRNPLGKIKDTAFSTLKYPLGAAGKAVGTVSDLVGARRLPPTEPAPAPPPQDPLPPRSTGPVTAAKPAVQPQPADGEPAVDVTPADVAAVVEKKAPARKPATRKAPAAKKTAKKAPATKSSATKSAAGKSPARKSAANRTGPEAGAGTAPRGPGDKLPFPPREPEADAPTDSEPLLDPGVAKSVASEAEVAQRGAEVTKD